MICKGRVGEISFEDLKSYTDNFSEDNFIEDFQFGKVYCGKIEDYDIIVKVYCCREIGDYDTITTLWMLKNDIVLEEERLRMQKEVTIKSHPGLAKMTGYCLRGQLAIVYDFNPVDTLRSFVINDTYSGSTIIPKEIVEISFEDLKSYTDNFSEDNFIGNFQFGKVYRGKIGDHDVTVKVWMPQTLYICLPGNNEHRMDNELVLHADSRIKSHPNLAKLIGYCHEGGQLAVLYDLNPVDTLRNFILRDDFTWFQRIKIALQLACLLQFLHIPCPPHKRYVVGNIDAAHFFLDKDYNLVLYEFSTFSGGRLGERRGYPFISGCFGYIDPERTAGIIWDPIMDVFAFGIILIGLITKKAFIVEDCSIEFGIRDDTTYLDKWATEEYERRKSNSRDKISLVHDSLEMDPDFQSADGIEATKLAMQCLAKRRERTKIDILVQQLLKLHILRDTLNLWAFNGIKRFGPKIISKDIEEISFEDLKSYTDNFSEDNFIGKFQFGKVYRGKIGDHDVTVKVWMPQTLYICLPGDNENRMEGELILHTDPRIKSHPNLAKLIGYCREGQLAVVYDLNPVYTLQTISLRDDFTWLQRIKTALQLARLLQFLQTPCPPYEPYVICNIDAAHFVLDKDYNLVLYDFSMFSGGFVPETKDYRGLPLIFGCFGYMDPFIYNRTGRWFLSSVDVFAFGIILVGLIAKKAFISEDYFDITSTKPRFWAYRECERKEKSGDMVSLVHESLEVDLDFKFADGLEVTKLANQCIVGHFRPKIDFVVQQLSKLHALRNTLKL